MGQLIGCNVKAMEKRGTGDTQAVYSLFSGERFYFIYAPRSKFTQLLLLGVTYSNTLFCFVFSSLLFSFRLVIFSVVNAKLTPYIHFPLFILGYYYLNNKTITIMIQEDQIKRNQINII